MSEWDARWVELMNYNNVELKGKSRYMDDIRNFMYALKAGWRWFDGELCYTETWRKEDMEAGLSPTKRTANVMIDSMNSIMSFLKFTQEIGEDFQDGKLPSLDTKIWVEGFVILFEFYEKSMSSNLVVHAKSALSEETKLSTLAEETCRRLRNTSRKLDKSRRMEILEELCTKMSTSGHTLKFMRRALAKGITNYAEKVRKSQLDPNEKGYQPLYQDSRWMKNEKAKGKAMKKSTWYRDGKQKFDEGKSKKNRETVKGRKSFQQDGQVRTATVVFVPSTKGGVLTRKLREREEVLASLTGFKIRFQEAGGSQLASLFSTDLGKGKHCGRDCPPCDGSSTESRQNCKARNVVYETSCNICNPTEEKPSIQKEGKIREGIYIGESSRSLHERSIEHLRDARSFSKKSHIAKHWMLAHPNINIMPTFSFKTIQKHNDCLSRQVGEAMKIYFSKDNLLNSKNEYLQNCISRVVVQEETWETREREKREEEEEKLTEARLNTFKELKLSIQLQDIHAPPTPPMLEGGTVTGNTQELRGNSLEACLETSTPLEGDQEDGQEGSILKEEDHGRLSILNTTKRKANWQELKNIYKRRKVEKLKKIPRPNHQVAEMNISGWWKRMERMEKRSPEKPRKSKAKGRSRKQGECDYKLAYMSLWWRRMERNEMKEKQERSMSKTLNAFLMAGKVDLKPNLGEEISCLQPNNTPRPIAKIQKVKEQCFVDSRTPSSQYLCGITSDMLKEHTPTSARPIVNKIKYFEDLLTNKNSGKKRNLRGKVESPAKHARRGPSTYYTSDFEKTQHTCRNDNKEYIHAQNQADSSTNNGRISGTSKQAGKLSPKSAL